MIDWAVPQIGDCCARMGVSLRSNLDLIEICNFLLLFDPICHYIRALMAVTNQQKGTSLVLVRIDRSGAAPDPTKRVGCYILDRHDSRR